MECNKGKGVRQMLKIITLIKQVPNTTEVKIDPVTNNLVREGVPSITNPYDLFAIEEALQLREKYGGTVAALSMGPPQALDMLKNALAMGVDETFLLSDRRFAGSDTLATSYTLAKGVEKIGDADLIICGKQAADGDTAQVPAELAEYLNLPCITYVSKILSIQDGKLLVHRTMDYGEIEVEVQLPAVITVEKGINTPRLPMIKNYVKAMYEEPQVWTADDLAVDPQRISVAGSPTQVAKVFSPERKKSGRILQGNTDDQVKEILAYLSQQQILN